MMQVRIAYWVWVVFLFLVRGPVSGQIQEADSLRLSGKVSLSGLRQSGNVEYRLLRGKAEGLYRFRNQWAFKSQNQYVYQAFAGRKADEDYYARQFLYYQPDRRVYPFALAFASGSFRRKIDFRIFAGLGATLRIYQRPGHSLRSSLSLMAEESRQALTRYNHPSFNGKARIQTLRPTFFLMGSHRFGKTPIRLHYEGWAHSDGFSSRNYRLFGEWTLELPLYQSLSFLIQGSYSFEDLVVLPVRREDAIFSLGLSWKGSRNRTAP